MLLLCFLIFNSFTLVSLNTMIFILRGLRDVANKIHSARRLWFRWRTTSRNLNWLFKRGRSRRLSQRRSIYSVVFSVFIRTVWLFLEHTIIPIFNLNIWLATRLVFVNIWLYATILCVLRSPLLAAIISTRPGLCSRWSHFFKASVS
jgi:hypothetical protein